MDNVLNLSPLPQGLPLRIRASFAIMQEVTSHPGTRTPHPDAAPGRSELRPYEIREICTTMFRWPSRINPITQMIVGLVWLVLAVLLGTLWQFTARSHQALTVGGPFDEGFLVGFYGREQTDDGRAIPFRWSRPEATLRLRPTPAPAVLSIHALAPEHPAGPSLLTLSQAGQPLASFALSNEFRVYRVFLPEASEPTMSLLITPATLVGDPPRVLGMAVSHVALLGLAPRTPQQILTEFGVFPWLPWGLVLVSISVGLAGSGWLRAGLAALGALASLALAAHLLPEAALTLAWMLTVAAGAITLALALVQMARRRPAARRDDAWVTGWLVALWGISFALSFAPAVASDGTGYYAYTRSLAFDRDLHFGNEYREMPFLHTPANPDVLWIEATGHYANPFAIGPGLLWLPGFGLAHLFVLLGGSQLWATDGYSLPYVVLTTLISALAGLVLLLALYRIARRITTPNLALLTSVTIYFGANLFYYAMREGSFAHSLSAMAMALAVLAWLRLVEQPGPGRWALLGAASGFAVLIYWTSALALVPPAALTAGLQLRTALRSPAPARRSQLRHLAQGLGLATVLGLLLISPQLIAWAIIFGSPVTVPQGTGYITPGEPVLLPFFFGPLRGLLPWTPAFFLGLLGLPLLFRQPWLGSAALLGVLPFLIYNMSIGDWHGSGAFGLRRLTVIAPWFVLGLAVLLSTVRRLHWVGPVTLAALAISWTTMLSWRYALYLIERDTGALRQLPEASFWLGRDILPLERFGDWISSSFFATMLALPSYGLPAGPPLLLALLVAVVAASAIAFPLLSRRRTQHA